MIRIGHRCRNPGEEHRRDRGEKATPRGHEEGNGHTAGSTGRGDRVIERFSQADMLGLLVQIGAVPLPA